MKIKVALLVDEYFGGAGTKYGGYGFLARNLIAKYLPSEAIQLEVILKKDSRWFRVLPKLYLVDGVKVYKLSAPFFDIVNKLFFRIKSYQVWVSIEMTGQSFRIFSKAPNKNKKLLFWIQDPRPSYEWDIIKTVSLFPEKSYWNTKIYDFVHEYYKTGNLRFISQARFLDQKARDLYRLPDNVPIKYLPNPTELDLSFDVNDYKKKNNVIFLGRIESVKRGWLFAELAKRMPQYNFYVLGQAHRQRKKNNEIMSRYADVANLHFVGHIEGGVKNSFLRDAKILVNTSIHEALPISFLEALSYGTLIVSCQNPDSLTERFGVFTGEVYGDGFDEIDRFVRGVEYLMQNEKNRQEKASSAVEYIRKVHSIAAFQRNMTEEIKSLFDK